MSAVKGKYGAATMGKAFEMGHRTISKPEEIPNELYMQLLILDVGYDSDKMWKIMGDYYSKHGKTITGFSWRGDMKIKPVVYYKHDS